MPETLGDLYTTGFYAWDSGALFAVSLSASPNRAFSAGSQSSVVSNVKSDSEYDVTENLLAVRPFDP